MGRARENKDWAVCPSCLSEVQLDPSESQSVGLRALFHLLSPGLVLPEGLDECPEIRVVIIN